ncbi:MAG: 7-carboxy-7-deazaguanine synthase QueE [Paramuribaculum sp.]|nr:7-carboxy-7-deazaguanine synthase QueE [Paramuribaculum sp.]
MRVNEIFYSLQGEGFFTGTAAVFIRLSGCNLRCSFCDTDHEAGCEMSAQEIADTILPYPTRHAVITGGEPGLQLSDRLVNLLHSLGYFIQVETNGTRELPEGIDWITCSPKYAPVVLRRVDELKVVYEGKQSLAALMAAKSTIPAKHLSVQPCHTPDPERNAEILAECIDFVKANPEWRLSLQTHKLLNIP